MKPAISLLFIALILPAISVAEEIEVQDAETFWRCSGELVMTNSDCDDMKPRWKEACFYVTHFEQYRACASVCNDILVNSISESRCRGYCPNYLNSACSMQKLTTPTTRAHNSNSTTASIITTTVRIKGEARKESRRKQQESGISLMAVALIVLAGLVTLAIIFVSLVMTRRCADKQKRQSKNQGNIVSVEETADLYAGGWYDKAGLANVEMCEEEISNLKNNTWQASGLAGPLTDCYEAAETKNPVVCNTEELRKPPDAAPWSPSETGK